MPTNANARGREELAAVIRREVRITDETPVGGLDWSECHRIAAAVEAALCARGAEPCAWAVYDKHGSIFRLTRHEDSAKEAVNDGDVRDERMRESGGIPYGPYRVVPLFASPPPPRGDAGDGRAEERSVLNVYGRLLDRLGHQPSFDNSDTEDDVWNHVCWLEQRAREQEQEACARVCEARAKAHREENRKWGALPITAVGASELQTRERATEAEKCAAAIRARPTPPAEPPARGE